MPLTRSLRIKLAGWLIVIPIAGLVGAVYSLMVYPQGSSNPGDWKVGAATGILIALFSIPLEIFSRELIRGLPRGLRRQATYLGEVLNAASRMERFAKNCSVELLALRRKAAASDLPSFTATSRARQPRRKAVS